MAKCIEIKPRYIDANEINWQQVEYEYGKRNNTIIACEIAVDETPEVDVAPITHAHWERHFKRLGVYEDLWLYCTNCNSRTSEEYAPYWWSYCPYCGAKMDEEVE